MVKGIAKKINGNAGVVSAVILIIGFAITILTISFTFQDRVDAQIEKHPRLERMELNLKHFMKASGVEYIE